MYFMLYCIYLYFTFYTVKKILLIFNIYKNIYFYFFVLIIFNILLVNFLNSGCLVYQLFKLVWIIFHGHKF